jgi:hypothetical protein
MKVLQMGSERQMLLEREALPVYEAVERLARAPKPRSQALFTSVSGPAFGTSAATNSRAYWRAAGRPGDAYALNLPPHDGG